MVGFVVYAERGPPLSIIHQACPPSADIIFYKTRIIHVFHVDKNGGKISEFRFLKKVLKMDFPKVYFFGSLRKSLSPISQNPDFAAIFHKTNSNIFICSTCRRYIHASVLRTSEGRRPVLSQSIYKISFTI